MPGADEGFRAVAFDLDGTLIDTAPDLCAAANAMLLELGGRELAEHRIRALVGDGVARFVERALEEGLGMSAPDAALRSAAELLFARLYGEHLFDRSRLYPGVPETLHQFASAGIALCCVTNKESRFALPLLEAAQLDTLLAFTLCADRSTDRKPSPNMLLAACTRFAVKPAELLYVGDSAGRRCRSPFGRLSCRRGRLWLRRQAISRASQAARHHRRSEGASPDVHATAPCAPFSRRGPSHGERL